VPKGLADTVRTVTRGRTLVPVVSLETRRTVHRLLDADGRPLAEVADDRVRADRPGEDWVREWREWEVELVNGDLALLDAAAALLPELGARPAAVSSKLAKTLGDARPVGRADPGGGQSRSQEDPATVLVADRIAEQVTILRLQDPLVRENLPEGVHRQRVAIRRLRSALATFRPLVDRVQTEPLRDELKWLAGELAPARDVEVQQVRLAERLAALTVNGESELVRGPVLARVQTELARRREHARRRVLEALDSQRYVDLLDALDRLVAQPSWTDAARRSAGGVVASRARHDWKRLRSRVAAVDDAGDAGARSRALHEVRKAAKRSRYAAEVAVPVHGADAARFAKAAKRVQSALGDHHDAFVAQALVRDLADAAADAAENAFTYGILHAEEEAALADADRRFHQAWARASRKKLRRWWG
jgi:CHAD domain-containing protein